MCFHISNIGKFGVKAIDTKHFSWEQIMIKMRSWGVPPTTPSTACRREPPLLKKEGGWGYIPVFRLVIIHWAACIWAAAYRFIAAAFSG